MTLRWSINYIWPVEAGNQKVIPPEDVTVDLTFSFDRARIGQELKRPPRTWLHLYRSWDAKAGPSATASALSDLMLWDQFNDGSMSGRSVLPFETLMAYGTSREVLAWSIRAAPARSGYSPRGEWGLFPIGKLRGKIEKIPDVRKKLDRQAADFEKHCKPALIQGY
jgi:hypothetical protein